MKHIVEMSNLLIELVDQGFIRPDWLSDSHQGWAAYQGEVIGVRTAPVMVGSLSNVVVAQCAADLERAFRCSREYAETQARVWATMAGDCWADGDLRRGSYCTYLVVVGAN